MVATPIKPSKWEKIPAAKAAVQAEWDKLRKLGCWDPASVSELAQVKNKALAEGKKIHVGRIFELCVEKHSELPPEQRKYKGRVVFQGNNVQDESGLSAVFADQGSSASFVSTSKVLDIISMLPGCKGGQTDAPSAYTQALLYEGDPKGYVETWVILPESQRPPGWSKFKTPVVKLLLALYGHPESGTFWESVTSR